LLGEAAHSGKRGSKFFFACGGLSNIGSSAPEGGRGATIAGTVTLDNLKTADISNGFEVPRMHKNSCTALYNLLNFPGEKPPDPHFIFGEKNISPPLAHPVVKV